MSNSLSRWILRGTAGYLGLAAINGLSMDIRAAFFASGPAVPLLDGKPYMALGLTEAHGLALILALVFLRMPAQRGWHAVAAATTLLLGTCNLLYWEAFHVAGNLPMGVVATAFHLVFGAANLVAAAGVLGNARSALAQH